MTLANRHILALEDEPVIALALEDLLIDAGAQPELVATVDDALHMLNDPAGIDAAILDVNIDGLTSYPVAERLSALRIPFIFSTGYGNAMHPPQFAATPTVAKPYTITEIVRALVRASAGQASTPPE